MIDRWEQIDLTIASARLIILLGLVGLYALFAITFSWRHSVSAYTTGESSPLLPNESATFHHTPNGIGPSYGSIDAPAPPPGEGDDEPGWARQKKLPRRTWWEYLKGYTLFFPYLWPSKQRSLQVLFFACFAIVMVQRGTNVLVPIQVGRVIDELSGDQGPVTMPWGGICLYILFRLLQGSNGLLNALRTFMWIPISQYSYRELSVASFEHVHSLSLEFHTGKKTGEVISALGKGNSLNTFLEQVTFQFVPMIIDLVVAIAFFLIEFDVYFALVVSIVTFWYIYLTIRLAQWRADLRREMNNADRDTDAIKNDSMQGYESVKYFNAEDYEFARYRGAVIRYQKAEYRSLYTLSLMNVSQNLIFTAGVMVACFIAAYQVTTNQLKVGKFVSLLTYLSQLQQPLNFFGTFFRSMQTAMLNSERMLELFKEKPTVVDKPSAQPLPTCEGDIRFNDVDFSYDYRKPALRGFTFHAKPGTTTAFVGESGGGKSTVFRLLFRFYEPQDGTIEVDGHNIDEITIDSLRRHIGVVPQDTVLFNETLMYNLKYANQHATDEEVIEACKAASIHDKILTFPDGYNTKVGERGLRLSGGEKQRVAIARTILKGARIVLLDEATAALDTETEQNIQEAFDTLGEGRTMLLIAHRLSTIVRADQILVLHEGQVIERGTHQELLDMRGRYYQMWRKQAKAQKADDEAKMLLDKAEKLRRESKDITVTNASSSTGSTPFTSEGEEDDRQRKSSVRSSAKSSVASSSGRRSRTKNEVGT